MYRRIQGSIRLTTAALGVLGLSLLAAVPTPTAGAQNLDQGQRVAASTIAASTAATTTATTQAAGPAVRTAAARYGWGRVVAGDEFNYKGQPNSKKWRVYNSKGHAGKGLRRPSAWNVDGNVATVTGSTTGLTGGMSARHGQKYGRWEARMKTNKRDPQYHPNILLWPDVSHRSCPEVNFAESTKDPTKIKFFLHYGCKPLQTSAQKTIDTTAWHTYAVEWTPTSMTGYIDGVVWFRDTNKGHMPPGSMHAAAQLDWFPQTGKSPRTSSMSIDWIRVHKL